MTDCQTRGEPPTDTVTLNLGTFRDVTMKGSDSSQFVRPQDRGPVATAVTPAKRQATWEVA